MGFGIDIVADSLCASLIKFCCVLNERSFKIEAFLFYNAEHIRLVQKERGAYLDVRVHLC